MTDLAFNNYCLSCDKLCSHNMVYCSEECKMADEQQSIFRDQFQNNTANQNSSEQQLVSPLLTPSLQHYNNYVLSNQQLIDSPLLLPVSGYSYNNLDFNEKENDDLDSTRLDLNYSVHSSNNTLSERLPSTSHNYRKWLTACL